jgi:Txe/YoeB family toxin of Txe-Axe toxin-antitoxin module
MSHGNRGLSQIMVRLCCKKGSGPFIHDRLEALRGDRAGQWSIRINDQWRVCFEWNDGHASRVEICD